MILTKVLQVEANLPSGIWFSLKIRQIMISQNKPPFLLIKVQIIIFHLFSINPKVRENKNARFSIFRVFMLIFKISFHYERMKNSEIKTEFIEDLSSTRILHFILNQIMHSLLRAWFILSNEIGIIYLSLIA
jgi:hypothetical protein